MEYWKSRAMTAEDAFRQIQSELKKERRERKEFEHLVTQRFDQFCQAYEERLLGEMMTRNQQLPQSNQANISYHASNSSKNNPALSSTPRVNDDLVVKRSNTPTPRRAAPVPPARRSQA